MPDFRQKIGKVAIFKVFLRPLKKAKTNFNEHNWIQHAWENGKTLYLLKYARKSEMWPALMISRLRKSVCKAGLKLWQTRQNILRKADKAMRAHSCQGGTERPWERQRAHNQVGTGQTRWFPTATGTEWPSSPSKKTFMFSSNYCRKTNCKYSVTLWEVCFKRNHRRVFYVSDDA